jgi:carbon monoxide dehydrogenase subunit G
VKLSGAIRIAADPDAVWRVVSDMSSLAACVPGGSDIEASEDAAELVSVQRAGPVIARFRVSFRRIAAQASSRSLVLEGRAEDREHRTTVRSTSTLEVRGDAGTTGSVLLYSHDLVALGQLVAFAAPLVRDRLTGLQADFAACILERVG